MGQNKLTVDFNEVNTFTKLSDDWWDTMEILHKFNDVRVPALVENLYKNECITKKAFESDKPLLGLNILEIGSGGGFLSEHLAVLGANMTGVEVSLELVECAKLHAKSNKNISGNLTYICDTVENYSKQNPNKYDVVVASEIVEHVNEVDLFLECCIKLVKPNGAVYVTTINRTMRSWLFAIILYEYILKLIPRGVHDWYKFITPDELKHKLKKYDCSIMHTSGFEYNYFKAKFNFCEDTSVFFYTFAIKNE